MTTAAGMPKEKMVRIFLNALIKHKLIDWENIILYKCSKKCHVYKCRKNWSHQLLENTYGISG